MAADTSAYDSQRTLNEGDMDDRSRHSQDLDASREGLSDIEKGPDDAQQPAPSAPTDQLDPFFVDFDGPNDPDNPKNWTTKRRWAITCTLGALVWTVTFASSIFSVNIMVVEEKFGVSLVTATLGVALFVLVCPNSNLLMRWRKKC